MLRAPVEQDPVGEAGQGVVVGLMGQLRSQGGLGCRLRSYSGQLTIAPAQAAANKAALIPARAQGRARAATQWWWWW